MKENNHPAVYMVYASVLSVCKDEKTTITSAAGPREHIFGF